MSWEACRSIYIGFAILDFNTTYKKKKMSEEEAYPVKLYVYDLSQGLAGQFTGNLIEAVYHTSVVVHNKEYFFSRGITYSVPGKTIYGLPMEVVDVGKTYVSEEILEEYLADLKSTYLAESYDLFHHNCNNFSSEVVDFLTNQKIPEKISSLPQRALATPLGQQISVMLSLQFTNYATSVGPNDHSI